MDIKNKKIQNTILNIIIMFSFLSIATGIGFLFFSVKILETNIVLVYVFSVFLISIFTRNLFYGIVSSILSIVLYNFFFTSPYFTFILYDYNYIITFIVMVITSVITSILTMKLQMIATESNEKEKESYALYQLTNRLTDAESIEDIAGFAVKTVSHSFNCLASCICYDKFGELEKMYIQQKDAKEQIHRELTNANELKNRMNNLLSDHDEDNDYYNYPIRTTKRNLAIIRIPVSTAKYLSDYQKRLLHSILESTSIAMDGFITAEEESKIRQTAEREQYKSNLLRSISHDLRTPLSGIIGTSEIIIDMSKDNPKINELSNEIHESAEWLHSLVENILNLTRIQDGKLVMNRTLESIEDIIGVSVSIIEKRYNRNVDVQTTENPLLVSVDAKLINQVLINLLDNAVKHTENNGQIGIKTSANLEEKTVSITVYDEGTGISSKDLPNIFDSFYTSSTSGLSDNEKGVGLGLAICQSVIKAHNGTIVAKNRKGKGAEFIVTLPLDGEVENE